MLVIRDPDQAAALLQPERRRLLEALADPDSAAGLARRFELPRQRLNYHLKELEKAGLVELVEERRKGNCTERVLKATARAYAISPEVLGTLTRSPDAVPDRLSAAYLVAIASRVVQELGGLLSRAAAAHKRVATMTLDTDVRFESAAARAEFTDELTRTVARLAAKYQSDAPGGRAFRFVCAVYPKPADSDSAADSKE